VSDSSLVDAAYAESSSGRNVESEGRYRLNLFVYLAGQDGVRYRISAIAFCTNVTTTHISFEQGTTNNITSPPSLSCWGPTYCIVLAWQNILTTRLIAYFFLPVAHLDLDLDLMVGPTLVCRRAQEIRWATAMSVFCSLLSGSRVRPRSQLARVHLLRPELRVRLRHLRKPSGLFS
jgi:hypothetical protein